MLPLARTHISFQCLHPSPLLSIYDIHIYIYIYIDPSSLHHHLDISGPVGSVMRKGNHTSSLLLETQFRPVGLHAVSQAHPEISLLLRWQALPSLLDVRQRWGGDGVGGAGLHRSYDARCGAASNCCAEHCVGFSSITDSMGIKGGWRSPKWVL
jgi:hypothetical protein